MNDKERAKEVLVEIIRQCGGDYIEGKTKLFKAFYFAHLYYAKENTDFLSDWPIVKMPRGPGIDRFDELIGELRSEGLVEVYPCEVGPYPSVRFAVTEKGRFSASPGKAAVKAIRKTVEFVEDKTASRLSSETHSYSKTWNDTEPGHEMNIYLDLLTEEEYLISKQRSQRIASQLKAAWD